MAQVLFFLLILFLFWNGYRTVKASYRNYKKGLIEGRNDSGKYKYNLETNPKLFYFVLTVQSLVGFLLIIISSYLLLANLFGNGLW